MCGNCPSKLYKVRVKETQEDIQRVAELGCQTVEMEVAALYAIAQEKNKLQLFL
jgi:purine-nucleoside phosphorylase